MNLEGYSIETIDGSISKIDEATNKVGSGYLVVDTQPLDLREEGRSASRPG